jgi:hypothetical protein
MDKKELKIVNNLLLREIKNYEKTFEHNNKINLDLKNKYDKAIKENVCLTEKIEDYKVQLEKINKELKIINEYNEQWRNKVLVAEQNYFEVKELNVTLKNEIDKLIDKLIYSPFNKKEERSKIIGKAEYEKTHLEKHTMTQPIKPKFELGEIELKEMIQ